jgi:hypothetical protein
METKFTPGPWKAVFDDRKIYIEGIGVPTDKNEKANAHLIAAAPELYEALEALLSYKTDAPLYFQENGRAALKKARGE